MYILYNYLYLQSVGNWNEDGGFLCWACERFVVEVCSSIVCDDISRRLVYVHCTHSLVHSTLMRPRNCLFYRIARVFTVFNKYQVKGRAQSCQISAHNYKMIWNYTMNQFCIVVTNQIILCSELMGERSAGDWCAGFRELSSWGPPRTKASLSPGTEQVLIVLSATRGNPSRLSVQSISQIRKSCENCWLDVCRSESGDYSWFGPWRKEFHMVVKLHLRHKYGRSNCRKRPSLVILK